MKLKTSVGQIFLTHPKDENFASLYEEAFSKHGQTVELFAVLEIADKTAGMAKTRKAEYEQVMQTLVLALKKTYIASPAIDHNTFEKALTTVNAALSRLVSKNRVSWFSNLHAAIGVIFQNRLSLSTTGNALVYLIRKQDLSLLSEDLAETATRPVKIFSNYSTGQTAARDRIIITTSKLFNFLSTDRIREFLKEPNLDDACQEIIQSLADTKTAAFATFICEINADELPAKPNGPLAELFSRKSGSAKFSDAPAAGKPLWIRISRSAWEIAKYLGQAGYRFLSGLFAWIYDFFRRRPKKYVFAAIAVVLALLLLNIGLGTWRQTHRQKQNQQSTTLSDIEKKLGEAEGALIYKDENRATALLLDADRMLAAYPDKKSAQYKTLADRASALKSKLSREIRADNPTVLTKFPNIPTNLLRSPDGFLAFNHDTQTLAFYDFHLSQTKTILQNINTSNLLFGAFVGAPQGYLFLDRDGNFERLDLSQEQLVKYAAPSVSLTNAKIAALQVLGEGNNARIYLLDRGQNQIWRLKMADKGPQPAEAWLNKNQTPNFADGRDLAVDGNVYILFADRLDKYFNGQKQNFALAPTAPPLKNALRIFTAQNAQSIYILDRENQRVLVFDKQGKLKKQILSAKFRDLSDIYADELNKTLYALSGSELLQISLAQ